MDSLSSSVSTVPSIDDYFEHNVWNLALEMVSLEEIHWAPLPMEFLLFLWHHCHPGVVVSVLCVARRYKCLFHISFTSSCWGSFLSYGSVSICGIGKNGHHLETRKNCVGDVPSCCFWVKFLCPTRRFIVVRHGGNVYRDVYCILFLR